MQRLSVLSPHLGNKLICISRQDVGLYPARHVCNSNKDAPPPLPIINLRATSQPQPNADHDKDITSVSTTATETVERAKVAVGRGWEAVRNMNWKDMTKKEPESNGSRMWGRLLEATSSARQKVADKYYEVREGGNGFSPQYLFAYNVRIR